MNRLHTDHGTCCAYQRHQSPFQRLDPVHVRSPTNLRHLFSRSLFFRIDCFSHLRCASCLPSEYRHAGDKYYARTQYLSKTNHNCVRPSLRHGRRSRTTWTRVQCDARTLIRGSRRSVRLSTTDAEHPPSELLFFSRYVSGSSLTPGWTAEFFFVVQVLQ